VNFRAVDFRHFARESPGADRIESAHAAETAERQPKVGGLEEAFEC
jgi:hypothetical protein